MACNSWLGLNRVLVEVETVKIHPFMLQGAEDRRNMSCKSAAVTGKVLNGLSKGARKSGTIHFNAYQSGCAGLDDSPDDPIPKRGDRLVLAWDLPDPEADDYSVSEYSVYLADLKECSRTPKG
jgi:hypothetical protein